MNPQASWRNPRVLLILLLIFLCGALAGSLTTRYAFQPKPESPAGYWARGGKQMVLDHFKRELDLTPDQTRQIELILDDFVLYYDTLQSQMDDVRANGKSRIFSVLNPEQRRKFEKMASEVKTRRRDAQSGKD